MLASWYCFRSCGPKLSLLTYEIRLVLIFLLLILGSVESIAVVYFYSCRLETIIIVIMLRLRLRVRTENQGRSDTLRSFFICLCLSFERPFKRGTAMIED